MRMSAACIPGKVETAQYDLTCSSHMEAAQNVGLITKHGQVSNHSLSFGMSKGSHGSCQVFVQQGASVMSAGHICEDGTPYLCYAASC